MKYYTHVTMDVGRCGAQENRVKTRHKEGIKDLPVDSADALTK